MAVKYKDYWNDFFAPEFESIKVQINVKTQMQIIFMPFKLARSSQEDVIVYL